MYTDNSNDLPDDFKYSVKVISCEPEIQSNFQRKVYSLLSAQLLITFIFSLLAQKSATLQLFVVTHRGLWLLSMVVSVVSCIWLSSVPNPNEIEQPEPFSRASPPWYYLPSKKAQLFMLLIFTLAESYSIALVTISYDSDTVLSALLVTLVIVAGATIFSLSPMFQASMQTITSMYYWLNWAVWLMIGIGISSAIFGFRTSNLIFGWLGSVVFTLYIFIDTQLIFRKCYIDDEIKCCMMLYLDIINLFLSILRTMSNSDD